MRFSFFSVPVLILSTSLLMAQDAVPPAGARPMKLADCISAALAQNPGLQASSSRVDAAAANVTEARSALFPQLNVSGRAMELSEVPAFSITLPVVGTQTLFPSITHNYGVRASVQQVLFSGFRVMRRIDMSESNAAAVQLDYQRDRSELVVDVATGYWNLYRAMRVDTVLTETVGQLTAHLADARNFQKQGLLTDLEVLKIETQLSEIEVKQIEARSNVRLATMRLNSLMGAPLQSVILPADRPDDLLGDSLMHAQDVNAVMRLALARRPEVGAMHERRNMQEAAVGAARGGWYPQLVLAADYDYARPNSRIIPPKDQWDKSWDVGVVLQWNVWDWFATAGQAEQARAGLQQAEAGLAQVRDGVAMDAAQSFFRLQEARERLGAGSKGVEHAREGYRIASQRFKVGLASNTDLLDAEVALLQARLTKTQAQVDYAIQMEQFKRAVGEKP